MLPKNWKWAWRPMLVILGVAGIMFSAPLFAQEYPGGEAWEEIKPNVGPAANSQILRTPPRVAASPVAAGNFRPPVEPPTLMASRAPANPVNHYIVQPGDTLPAIAYKALGDQNLWQELMAWNNISDPNLIRVGQRLNVTRPNSPRASMSDYEYVEPEEEFVSASADAHFYGQMDGTYVIQRGDTLGKIAQKLLGSSRKWQEIARANPRVDANRLIVGQTLIIPGAATGLSAVPMPVAPQIASAGSRGGSTGFVHQGAGSFDASGGYSPPRMVPSYDPPPIIAPPQRNAPIFSPPPSFSPPPYSPPSFSPPPYSPPSPHWAPPSFSPPPMVPAPPPRAVAPPITIAARWLYREERYRIPDELRPRGFTPYSANLRGYHGLFNTESSFYPYINTWHLGSHFRYDNYRYLNGEDNIIRGRQWILSSNLLYTGKKMMVGITLPYQSWEVERANLAGGNKAALSGGHDPEIRLGYQIWKNYEGDHAVSLHLAGRFSGNNHHQPIIGTPAQGFNGKSRVGVRVGPAGATRGGWVGFGGAYSGQLNDRWASHLNFAMANNAQDGMTKYMYRGSMDYRVNHNFSLVMELDGASYEMDNGPSGSNVDALAGMVLFNDSWQATLGLPMNIQSKWGYGKDYGIIFGLNHRWD